jgi:CHAT domain-containing protein
LAETLPTTRHLHLACHATVGLTPATTRLDLGSERPLTLVDLIELRLPNLDSVIAAACNTAVSGGAAPDELLGLAYGFLAAGAAEVVASLWHIDDETTALLVARLYHEWRNLDLCDSLAAAQRWIANVTNDELRQLVHGDATWLPSGLRRLWAPRLLVPRHRVGSDKPFVTPAYWAGLIYVGR